jgi:hypothetical protein
MSSTPREAQASTSAMAVGWNLRVVSSVTTGFSTWDGFAHADSIKSVFMSVFMGVIENCERVPDIF